MSLNTASARDPLVLTAMATLAFAALLLVVTVSGTFNNILCPSIKH